MNPTVYEDSWYIKTLSRFQHRKIQTAGNMWLCLYLLSVSRVNDNLQSIFADEDYEVIQETIRQKAQSLLVAYLRYIPEDSTIMDTPIFSCTIFPRGFFFSSKLNAGNYEIRGIVVLNKTKISYENARRYPCYGRSQNYLPIESATRKLLP